MLQKVKTRILRLAAAAFDRWLRGMSPGERMYVLEEIDREVLNRLTQARQADLRPGALQGHLRVLREHYAREAEKLSRAEQVELFRSAAIPLGVDSYSASGPLGVFLGSSLDSVVLSRYAAYGTWDPAYQVLLSDHLLAHGRGTLVDIGANIGLTSIPIVRERQVACYAFEPEPRSYLYLRQNVLANAVESLVTCVNLALFSEERVLQLELADRNLGDHRVQGQALNGDAGGHPNADNEKRETIEVRSTTLDRFFKGKSLEPPIVVKNDTQGSEVQVLRGASEFLGRVDYLISEFDPHLLKRMGDSVDAYVELIMQFPYGALQDSPDDLSRASREDPPRLEPTRFLAERMRAHASTSAPDNYVNLILARHAEFDSR